MNARRSNKLSVSLLALGALVGALSLATPAEAAPKTTANGTNVAAVEKTASPKADKSDVKALRRRQKLPRKWVWKKYAKRFDTMYRR